jgi:plasmid maintenance system antidote protein VapI
MSEPFADALKEAIRGSGLSLTHIEADTGVQRASLSRFLAGRRTLRLDMADRLAVYFKLTVRSSKPNTPRPRG